MSGAEELLSGLVAVLKLGAEGAAALIVGIGLVAAVVRTVRLLKSRRVADYRHLRLGLSRALVLALEFQLAADILGTTMDPTWAQLGKLGVIATIRTSLNFFLEREMRELREAEAAPEHTGKGGAL